MKPRTAEESWYQVQRDGYGMPPSLVSQPALGLEDAKRQLERREAAERAHVIKDMPWLGERAFQGFRSLL